MAVLHFGIKSIMLQGVICFKSLETEISHGCVTYFFSCAIMSVSEGERGQQKL